MKNPLTWLSRRRFPYEPLIKVEISKSRLTHNLNEFKKLAPENKIAPVLKSNAYGHGLLEIANLLESEIKKSGIMKKHLPFFVVDSYFEAVALRAKGIKTPLLIIGYTRPETILTSHLSHISYTISNLESLQAIKNCKHTISIHLKIDTGMHRQGILPSEIDQTIQYLKNSPRVSLDGICSHLCDADNQDSKFTKNQISIWNNAVKKIKNEFPNIKYIHLSATDGHKYSPIIEANVSRLGLGLYGITEKFNAELDLQPVLEMKTIITGIKKLRQGETIGYNNTFKAERDMTVATIPVGYFEGVDRKLSNIGAIEVVHGSTNQKTICPIIGRVSMNITSIDISGISDVSIGTEVIVISNNPSNKNSIQSISKLCGTIEYERAVHIPEHLKRVISC
ncbi:MAG: alanine racemase [Candidatus Paceibacterota bacterium]